MANSPLTRLLERRKRVFYGWWIAIAGAVQDAVKGGTFDEGFLAAVPTLDIPLFQGVWGMHPPTQSPSRLPLDWYKIGRR